MVQELIENINQPIRVLCVFAGLDRGGAESMCMNLYRKIDREKVQFDFVKHTATIGAFEEEIKALGGRIYEAPQYKIYNHIKYCTWWKKHLINHPEHKIIHGHYFTISKVYFKVAKEIGRITIGHSHSTKSNKVNLRRMLQICIMKNIERYTDYAFACSQKAGEWLFPNMKFEILNNAIDTKKFVFDEAKREKIRNELGINDECFVVGTVGRLTYPKNPLGIIDIFHEIKMRNENSLLLWVGDGELRTEIEEKIKKDALEKDIMMLGVCNNVNNLMQAMDIFILPSNYEGLPVVLIEAQAAGLPCIGSACITDEVDITGDCRFVDRDDINAWAENALELRNFKRKNNYKSILDAGYDIHSTAQWIQAFYLSIDKYKS
jgi:glycosyltransferase involved in cell wall biosynthesis